MPKNMRSYIIACCICLFTASSAAAQSATKENTKTTKETTTDRLKLYPNPAKTYTNIYVDWLQAQPFSIVVYDMQYNSQLTEIKVGTRKSYQYSLDVTQLPNGKYKIIIKGNSTLEEILTVSR